MAATTPEQYREAIVTALEDVERLSQTIRALLLLSHAESGQLALHKQVVDVSQVALDIVDQFGIPAESANVELRCHVPAGVLAEVDQIQIERLISNLVSNALKYTRPGGEVIVELVNSQYQVHLHVSDTGVGIAAEHLPYIFDRFYRVPEADRPPGTSPAERGLGLGLSFVAWIVRAHNGMIHVESEPGKGSRFSVCLPKGRAAATGASAYPPARNDSSVQQSPAVR
jgi:signal transduction histidine kinase